MVNELVQKLSEGKHDTSLNERGEDLKELKESIENGFIHVKFTKTKGATELGIKIDKDKFKLDGNFEKGTGELHLEGTTTLNYNNVRCIVNVNLKTMKGTGYLKVMNNNVIH